MIPILERLSSASAMTTASLAELTTIQNPNTSTLLSLFQPDIDAGLLRVPVMSPDGKDQCSVIPLTMGLAVPGLGQTLQGIVSGVDRAISTHQKQTDQNEYRDIPLPATNGLWEVYSATEGAEAELRSQSARFLRIGLYEEKTKILCGYKGDCAEAIMAATIHPQTHEVLGMSYTIEFKSSAMVGLMRLLGLENTTLRELASEVARRVFRSGQYSLEELNWPPRKAIWTDEGLTVLDSDDREFALPPDHHGMDSTISSRGSVPVEAGWGAVYPFNSIPILSIHTDTEDEESLEIIAHFPARETRLMPLKSILRDLWIGALMFADPS
jgi:hypothetical protein